MLQDFRFATRTLAKRPASSLLAILALGLGIGLVTTQFSFMNGVVLKGLPFEDSGKVYHLSRTGPQGEQETGMPVRDYLLWRGQQTTFEDLAAFEISIINLSGTNILPQHHLGAAITSSLFKVLRVQPIIGRPLHSEDDLPGAPVVALIGEGLWNREFGGDPEIVGREIRVNGEPATIVGVMPEVFKFPTRENIWINLRPEAGTTSFGFTKSAIVIGRLRDNLAPRDAQAELDVIASRLAREFPENKSLISARMVPYIDHFNGRETKPIMLTMFGMVTGILLIACTNVANLLLARASGRGKEMAIRTALGATRGRLFRQLISESIVLAAGGALLGVLIAVWGTELIAGQLLTTNAPFWFDVTIDGTVLLVTLAVTLLAGFVTGTMPAIQASRADVNSALKDESRGSSSLRMGRFSKSLVVVQVAISCGVLILTVLMAKTVVLAQSTKFPFDPDQVVSARIELMDQEFPEGPLRERFYARLLEGIRALPSVEAATLTSRHPVQPGVRTSTEIEGQVYEAERQVPQAFLEVVTADYFRTLNIPLLEGRDFSEADTPETPAVAIVNEAFARAHWPGESPLGKRLRRVREGQRWATVVGVVPDLRMQGVFNNLSPAGYYLPQKQEGWGWMNLLIRPAGGAAAALAQPVRELVASLAPDQPIHSFEPVAATHNQRLAVPRFISRMFIVFGAAALFLGAVGLYGVTAFSVNQRVREFGIRFALGARVADVIRMVMAQGSLQIILGLAGGLGLAYGLSRPLAFLLTDVSPNDPSVYGLVLAFVTIVALLAIWIPARRASRIDPMTALRND